MMNIEDRIKKLNIILPEAKDPVGKNVATKIINNCHILIPPKPIKTPK